MMMIFEEPGEITRFWGLDIVGSWIKPRQDKLTFLKQQEIFR